MATLASDADDGAIEFVPEQGETEADLTTDRAAFSASIASRDWTVETLASQMRKARIDLSPSFQRRNAWLENRKSKLIESMLLGFPIPQIVLAERQGRGGHYFVLDGKQRLLAIRQFFADPGDERDAGFEPLALRSLEVLTHLNGSTFADLEESHPDLSAQLENYTIRTVVLSDWSSEDMLLSLFLRLNTGSVALSPQELRQALIPGAFVEWLDETSGSLQSLRNLLGNTHPDRRMNDAELTLRHLSFAMSPLEYRGNLKQFLDNTSRVFNQDWASLAGPVANSIVEFDAALTLLNAELGSHACRKWSGERFERALNRAVFDIQVYSLSIPEVRSAFLEAHEPIMAQYKISCEKNEAFVRSISATTKTSEAFRTRHVEWRRIVNEVCGISYDLPRPLHRP